MCFPVHSALGGFASLFPGGGSPVLSGLVGQGRQGGEDLAQIVFWVDVQCRAAPEQTVKDGARLPAVGSSEEQPVLFTDGREEKVSVCTSDHFFQLILFSNNLFAPPVFNALNCTPHIRPVTHT